MFENGLMDWSALNCQICVPVEVFSVKSTLFRVFKNKKAPAVGSGCLLLGTGNVLFHVFRCFTSGFDQEEQHRANDGKVDDRVEEIAYQNFSNFDA